MKVCTKCAQTKDESDFYRAEKGKERRRNSCKICMNERVKRHYWKPGKKAKHRDTQLKHDYGIGVKQYDELFENQNGVCAICRCPETKKNQYGVVRLSVDHNHKTGKVRGLLCMNCNNGLGRMKDSKDILSRASLYLEQNDG